MRGKLRRINLALASENQVALEKYRRRVLAFQRRVWNFCRLTLRRREAAFNLLINGRSLELSTDKLSSIRTVIHAPKMG